MAHYHARVDTSRQIKCVGGVREVPIVVNGAEAVAAFDEEAFVALAEVVSTIQRKLPEYTYISAVERATMRAIEDGMFRNGVVKVTPSHV